MSAQVSESKSQVNSNQKTQVSFSNCLIITRHKLLPAQEEDIKKICQKVEIKPELPNDPNQLKQLIQPFDAIIATLPLPLQIQILQAKKYYITFVMTSLGTVDTKQEAEAKASQYQGRTAILAPSKEGEKYRVTRYDGLKIIREIKVIDEWIIQHQS